MPLGIFGVVGATIHGPSIIAAYILSFASGKLTCPLPGHRSRRILNYLGINKAFCLQVRFSEVSTGFLYGVLLGVLQGAGASPRDVWLFRCTLFKGPLKADFVSKHSYS